MKDITERNQERLRNGKKKEVSKFAYKKRRNKSLP